MNKKIFALYVLLAAPTHAGNTPSTISHVTNIKCSSVRFNMFVGTKNIPPANQSRDSDSDDDDATRAADERLVQDAMAGIFLAHTERMHPEALESLQDAFKRDGIEPAINWNVRWVSCGSDDSANNSDAQMSSRPASPSDLESISDNNSDAH